MMNAKQLRPWNTAVVVIASLFCITSLHAKKPDKPGGGPAEYTIVPFLPPGFASDGSIVTDLNELGQAVGYAELPSGTNQAVHLDIATDVYTPLTAGSYAAGVNNLNQIAGNTQIDGATRAAFWPDPFSDPVELPPLTGDVISWCRAINDDGIIVGESHDGDTLKRGVVWRAVVDEFGTVDIDGPVLLPAPIDTTDWLAADVGETINNAAIVAGDLILDNSPSLAAVWLVELDPQDGSLVASQQPTTLGTLNRSDPSESSTYATNTFGDVCGNSDRRPFIAPAGQMAQPLPVPRDTQWGRAMDVNNLGEVVGQLDIYKTKGFINGPGNYHPYLWKDGEMIDLEKKVTLGQWDRLWAANVINDSGVIAGFGRMDVEFRGFLLIPNEP